MRESEIPLFSGGLNYADGLKHIKKEFKKLSRDKEDKNGNTKKKVDSNS